MKKFFSTLLCLLLLTALPCAAQEEMTLPSPVTDQANLLTREEEVLISGQAVRIHDEYGLYMAILTVNGLGGKTSTEYADDYYDEHYYSQYPDGVLLLIAMDSREWAISTCGRAIDLLTDYELDQIFFTMADELSNDLFYDAFSTYLETLPLYLAVAPDTPPGIADYVRIFVIALLIGAAAGGITVLVMRRQMNTAKPQASAGNYLVNGSYQLKRHHDVFLYSRVTRTKKPENNGGGGSSHRSSGGISHGGRRGRF